MVDVQIKEPRALFFEDCLPEDVALLDTFDGHEVFESFIIPAYAHNYFQTFRFDVKNYLDVSMPEITDVKRCFYSVDTEFCSTKKGKILKEVTVVDSLGEVVYEAHVGKTWKDDDPLLTTFRKVQDVMRKRFEGTQNVFVAHSPNSDMLSLKLKPKKMIVADTQWLIYPIKPAGSSLRDMTMQFFSTKIQGGKHSSKVDAISQMNLLRYAYPDLDAPKALRHITAMQVYRGRVPWLGDIVSKAEAKKLSKFEKRVLGKQELADGEEDKEMKDDSYIGGKRRNAGEKRRQKDSVCQQIYDSLQDVYRQDGIEPAEMLATYKQDSRGFPISMKSTNDVVIQGVSVTPVPSDGL